MEITNFSPTHGAALTAVTITLTSMPANATQEDTFVFLGGSAVTSVDGFELQPNGNATISITLGDNAQSGDFAVVCGDVHAMSAEVFTVDHAEGEPSFTSMTPRNATRGSQVTLNGENLDLITGVIIGNTTQMNISHIGSSMIRFMVPQTVPTGVQRVTGRSQEYGRVNSPYSLTVQ